MEITATDEDDYAQDVSALMLTIITVNEDKKIPVIVRIPLVSMIKFEDNFRHVKGTTSVLHVMMGNM